MWRYKSGTSFYSSEEEAICNMWQLHYQGLLNSSTDLTSKPEVLNTLADMRGEDMERVKPEDIKEGIKYLKKGRSGGLDTLSAEHIIYSDANI